MRNIHTKFLEDHPKPTLKEPETVSLADAMNIQQPDVQRSVQRWIASLTEGEPPIEFVLGTGGAYPRPAVARVLSELEGGGWQVAHVSEERAVTHADDGRSEAATVGAWILLHKAPE
jgi:hypothetical protein